MNAWIMVAIAIGILAIAGVVVVNAGFIKAADDAQQERITSCESCGGRCSAGNNCGLATCGAINGGKCTCGQK